MKHCLTIAGSDCSGGAGVQADIKAFCANGVYAMSVITSVVAENTKRVISVYDMPLDAIEEQIDSVFEDISVDGVKIGMTKSSDIMECIAEKLKFYQPPKIVLDPVMLAKNNHPLMEYRALNALRENLIPLATVITPNIPEAEMIAGQKITNIDNDGKTFYTVFAGRAAEVAGLIPQVITTFPPPEGDDMVRLEKGTD